MNGTDALEIVETVTAAGAIGASGQLRITAI